MSQETDQVLEGTTRPLPRMRRTAARRLTEAWSAPVIHLTREVDMTRMLEARDRENGVTVTDALLQACARALTRHPDINAHFAGEAVTTFERVNLGFAVATDAGLTVPVIHGADLLDLARSPGGAARPWRRRARVRCGCATWTAAPSRSRTSACSAWTISTP